MFEKTELVPDHCVNYNGGVGGGCDDGGDGGGGCDGGGCDGGRCVSHDRRTSEQWRNLVETTG